MAVWLFWTDHCVLTPNNIEFWIKSVRFGYILALINANVTAFKSAFTEHFGVVIITTALVGFLYNLGVQYILVSFFIYLNITLK